MSKSASLTTNIGQQHNISPSQSNERELCRVSAVTLLKLAMLAMMGVSLLWVLAPVGCGLLGSTTSNSTAVTADDFTPDDDCRDWPYYSFGKSLGLGLMTMSLLLACGGFINLSAAMIDTVSVGCCKGHGETSFDPWDMFPLPLLLSNRHHDDTYFDGLPVQTRHDQLRFHFSMFLAVLGFGVFPLTLVFRNRLPWEEDDPVLFLSIIMATLCITALVTIFRTLLLVVSLTFGNHSNIDVALVAVQHSAP